MIYGDAVVLKARGVEENIVGKVKAGTGHRQDKGNETKRQGTETRTGTRTGTEV